MRPALKSFADIILALAVLALSILYLIPWTSKKITTASNSGRSESPLSLAAAGGNQRVDIPSKQIASLFGWREKEHARPAAPREEPLPEAAWLKPVGFVDQKGSGCIYIFKDTRSSDMFSMAAGCSNGGWKLLEVREQLYVLELEGKKYMVKRVVETR